MIAKPSISQRGFTIIELLTVLVIIGVLTTLSLVAYGNARDKSRLARIKANLGEIALSLDDFARDHNSRYPALTDYHNTPPLGYTTNPGPPPDPVPGVPVILKRKGNAIVGGGPMLADTGNQLQDDFFRDQVGPPKGVVSYFRKRQGELPFVDSNGDGLSENPMRPVDQLVLNGHFDAYPLNPLAGPGVPMVNIAHMLYDYDSQTNDFNWVQFILDNTGEVRVGLCAARPAPGGLYEPIETIWTEDSYPQGDFAYIPFEFTNEQGTYCNGYWLIAYGDLSTLKNSEYNKLSLDQFGVPIDPDFQFWPNLPPPFGDGDPNTMLPDTVEYQVKRLVLGALDIRATIFEDQLVLRND